MPGSSLIDPNDLGGSLQRLADRLNDLEATATIPVGMIAWFPSDVPNGWLLCDGSVISASRYGQLVAYLKTTTLPDMRGLTAVCQAAAGTFATLLAVGGAASVTLSAAESGQKAGNTGPGTPHQHAIHGNFGSGALNSLTFAGSTYNAGDPSYMQPESSHTHPIAGSAATNAHENMPPYIVLRAAIKF